MYMSGKLNNEGMNRPESHFSGLVSIMYSETLLPWKLCNGFQHISKANGKS